MEIVVRGRNVEVPEHYRQHVEDKVGQLERFDGKLKMLSIGSAKRLPQLPEFPTTAEAGNIPGYIAGTWFGLAVTAGTPRPIVDKINAGVKKALEDPAVRKRIEDTGSLVVGNSPEEFAAQIKAEYEVYKKVVQSAKLKLD